MEGLNHQERKEARRYDTYLRAEEYTEIVYGGGKIDRPAEKMDQAMKRYYPKAGNYRTLFGELHGHTDLSDGQPDIDSYFRTARDLAKLDFCAVSDHDHGGVHSQELWGEKWDRTRECVKVYNEPGKFTTILAYERDAYPWYNNLVIYFNSYDQQIPRGSMPGEITKEELKAFLNREDLFIVPHTTSFLPSGCDFKKIDRNLIPNLIEVYSRWGTDEYFGNPNPVRISCEGGFWRDALEKGAKMGCICGSDDHQGMPGLTMGEATHPNLISRYPGITAVLAKDNTLPSIFEALKKRRCYGMMGGRIYIDFRINGYDMGEEIVLNRNADRNLYVSVRADKPIERISLVKNGRDYMHFNNPYGLDTEMEELIVDYGAERDTDYYYLRALLADGRYAWTSPIWISTEQEG